MIRTVSVTLVRPGASGPEVFLARRTKERDFLGGFYAFFAGRVESGDDELVVDTPEASDAHLRAAALRECLEECGVLFTTDGLRRLPAKTDLSNHAIGPLATSRLKPLGWWRTPQWMDPGFVTAFFTLSLSEEEGRALDDLANHLDTDEFDSGSWVAPSKALQRWERAEVLTTTPIRAILESFDSPGELLLGPTEKEAKTSEAIEICAGMVLLPLKTPTLPPATHTNCIVAGRDRFVVIDPGAYDGDSLRPLTAHLRQRLDGGQRCTAVVLTHHHRDHIGGVEPITELVDAPLLAHPETLKHIDDLSLPVKSIDDGDEIPVDHPGPLVALHTPGHAPGHIALYQPDTKVLIAGDLVASRGTIVVDPGEGNMGDYLTSLRRVRDLHPRLLIPAHGAPVTDPKSLLEHYLNHRQGREQKILDALREIGPALPSELVPLAYDDAPKAVWPLAERSLIAHLHHLVEQELAAEKDDGLFAAR